jgi:hypothetical protein
MCSDPSRLEMARQVLPPDPGSPLFVPRSTSLGGHIEKLSDEALERRGSPGLDGVCFAVGPALLGSSGRPERTRYGDQRHVRERDCESDYLTIRPKSMPSTKRNYPATFFACARILLDQPAHHERAILRKNLDDVDDVRLA